ncbi:hypothetical protein [Hirschia litorea]|uniref:Uncharacterized protein n=1 Tax=Hirschia litorea TaxID=1199156 RepID=A0ABW2IP52_9PROT
MHNKNINTKLIDGFVSARSFVAYAENNTHAALVEYLLENTKCNIRHVILKRNVVFQSKSLVKVHPLPEIRSTSPAHTWNTIQTFYYDRFKDYDLIYFQDQSWESQAISGATIQAGRKRCLIQDGFLSFDEKRSFGFKKWFWAFSRHIDFVHPKKPKPHLHFWKNRLLYNQHFFGITRPDQIWVFGESMKDRLIRQFGISAQKIYVTGPILLPRNFPIKPAKKITIQSVEKLKILFLDQCFLQYGRISDRNWKRNYLPLIHHLTNYDLTIKIHPAQTKEALKDIKHYAGDKARILNTKRLEDQTLPKIDIAVTVSSTSFVYCLSKGIPVIFYDVQALDKMPVISHPLIKEVGTKADLDTALSIYLANGKFNFKKGISIEYLINPG